MAQYTLRLFNGAIQNSNEVGYDFDAETSMWISKDRTFSIYDNNNMFTAVRDAIIVQDEIRAKRNKLLMDSDWTQIPDNPMTNKIEWATYRQALRDLPSQENFPNVEFPTAPTIAASQTAGAPNVIG